MPRWMRVIIATGVVGAALAAMLASSAMAQGTGHRRASLVCPASASQPLCCGPPVMGAQAAVVPCCLAATSPLCCGPVVGPNCCLPAQCPSGLSIAATPNPASEGHQATITGTLTGATVAGQTVDLYERVAGSTTFANVAQTPTDASGGFSFARAVTTNAQWYATANGVQSSTIAESVLAAVVLRPSSVRPAAGTRLKLTGTIAPSHAGERVALQRLRRGRWVTIARPKLGARSRFVVAQRVRARSVARFRVVLAADTRNIRSVSSVVAVTAR